MVAKQTSPSRKNSDQPCEPPPPKTEKPKIIDKHIRSPRILASMYGIPEDLAEQIFANLMQQQMEADFNWKSQQEAARQKSKDNFFNSFYQKMMSKW
ncbi:MAG: hypothetical protein R6U98_20190 [Pirellulaceae bacterium]